ncbi:hypothetical protein [Thalassotalea sediminis]|uniref:hypothetical protein n=1 Tax=Thalassotalea sediminis TaxID=1759089 RepID=UPI002573DE65|nr:hypothetical protein [Thalassotalea sediminis]
MKYLCCFVYVTVFLMGCSNKQLYQMGTEIKKSECINHAENETEYAACIQDKPMTYKEYKQLRKKVIEQNNKATR